MDEQYPPWGELTGGALQSIRAHMQTSSPSPKKMAHRTRVASGGRPLRHGEECAKVIGGVFLTDRNPFDLHPGVCTKWWYPPGPEAPGGPLAMEAAEEDGGQRTS